MLPDFGRASRLVDAVPVQDCMGGFSASETRNECAGRQGNGVVSTAVAQMGATWHPQ